MTNPILDFFGFSHLPFSKILSTRQIFHSTAYKEAFAQLEYGIPVEDIMLLSGPVGCGKSVVLNAVIRALDTNHYIPIYVRGNNLSEVELYKNILCGLDHQPPYFSGAAKRLFYRVVPELSKQPTIFIDDAQEMKDSALLALKSMVNFGSDSQHRITFVLCGQPELKAILKLSRFLALKQRIRLFFHMSAMSLQETCAYIDHHITEAGKPTSLFADDAKGEVHRSSEGIPRRVNVICYRSIVNAALNEISIIDSRNLVLNDLSD
jgi:type II secretory pathway predicted ATPase ExeA